MIGPIPIGGVALCIFFLALFQAARTRARLRARVISRHLEFIVGQNLPLPAALHMAAFGAGGKVDVILSDTGRLVAAGLPLAKALRQAYPACPGLLLSIVETGEKNGAVAAMLREFNRKVRGDVLPGEPTAFSNRWGFTAAGLVLLLLVWAGVSYFVLPKFAAVFADFGAHMPPLSRAVLQAWVPGEVLEEPTQLTSFFRFVYTALLLVPPLAIVCWIITGRPRRADSPGPIARLFDLMKWHIPLMRRSARWEGLSNCVPALRHGLAAGLTLPEAIEHAAGVDANQQFRRGLRKWAARIREGQETVNAARCSGLPEVMVRCVALGVRDGDFSAPLMHAENYYAWLIRRHRIIVAQAGWVTATLFFGLLTGAIAVGIVQALQVLTEYNIAQLW